MDVICLDSQEALAHVHDGLVRGSRGSFIDDGPDEKRGLGLVVGLGLGLGLMLDYGFQRKFTIDGNIETDPKLDLSQCSQVQVDAADPKDP